MRNQLRAEWFKLQRNKTFWMLLLIITGLSALLHYLVIIEWWQMQGTDFDRAGLSELNATSAFTIPLLFNLIVSTLAGFFISHEFSQSGVIKNQIISGSKRSHIFISKYLVFTLGSIVVTILIPLTTGIIEIILLGHGDILTVSSMLYLGRASSLFVLQFLGYTAIIILIAITTEDSGKTIIFSILLTIVMFAFEKLPKPPLINMIYENSIFYQFHEVFKFSMTNDEMLKSILIGFVTFIIITLGGISIFNKKEMK
ncbi:ABC-2 type transport system permease protein [Lentibacillus halodurans]|uniref:ABC-2 type transport system permease protein n=1 Tax=Lentibacillus halodurans TaxID=237679 RepID=A0A1I0YQQ8_9BACI|nr:ABC transporter permease [Lentibacillus halodurans]SFB15542.1 ABC-2 type transport system permease protein [Lentibacillus halodurans]